MAMTIDSEWQTFLRTMETANSMDFPTGAAATTESNRLYDSDGDNDNDDDNSDNSDNSSDESGTQSRKRARSGANKSVDLTKPPVAKYNRNPCEDLYISTQTNGEK